MKTICIVKKRMRDIGKYLKVVLLITGIFIYCSFAKAATTLLDENFNDGIANNWTVQAGSWSVISSQYHQSASNVRAVAYYANGGSWTNYTYSADVKAANDVGLIFRGNSAMDSYYMFRIHSSTQVELAKLTAGTFATLNTWTFNTTAGQFYNLSVKAEGSTITLKVGGTTIATVTDSSFSSGTVGIYDFYTACDFDNVLVTTNPPELNEDFNDGAANNWTVQAGTWSVTSNQYHQSATNVRAVAYYSYGSSNSWTDYTFSADVKAANDVGLAFRGNSTMDSYYMFRIHTSTQVELAKLVAGTFTSLNIWTFNTTAGQTYNLSAQVQGTTITLKVGTTTIATVSDASFSSGTVGFYDFYTACDFDNVVVSAAAPATYTLSVASGTGDGSYTQGQVVNIASDAPPSGSAFSQWTGDVSYVADILDSTTTVTMPAANINVTATYAELLPVLLNENFNDGVANNWTVQAGTWAVTSNQYHQSATNVRAVAYYANGNAWTDYTFTADVKAANDVGLAFRGNSAMDSYYMFRIHTSTQVELAKLTAGVFTSLGIWTYNTTAGQVYNMSAQVQGSTITLKIGTTVIATVTDSSFSSGTVGFYDFYTACDFDNVLVRGTMPATYTLTVASGTGDGSYTQGQVLNIAADAPQSGYEFDHWTGNVSYVADVNDPTTTVTMPAANVSVTATYVAISTHTLTVTSGTGDGSYNQGQVVTIVADAPQSGYVFDQWTGDVAYVANANNATTTVAMPNANVSVTATYMASNPNGATATPTFNCIGLYWGPTGGSSTNTCQVQYRISGSTTWKQALPMWYDSRSPAQYRGSIMNLTPNTNYEIKLTLNSGTIADFYCATWTEDFPVGSTVTLPATSSSTLSITSSGTANGYILYTPSGSSATIDMNRSSNSDCITISAGVHHVIIRGLTLRNPGRFGINLGNGCHDIIVDQCEITGWGRIDSHNVTITDSGTKLGHDQDGAIHCDTGNTDCTVYKLIVQYCYIHQPYYDTNPWTQSVTGDNGTGAHPQGPTSVYMRGPIGNNVIRYNDCVGTSVHRFNDILGGNQNNSAGYPGADSDIYGNYLAYYCDDAIESDGYNRNVRIWGNFMEHGGMSAISACSCIKGPLYAFRNVSGDRLWYTGNHGVFAKMSDYNGAGQQNWFHNTIRTPNGASQGISVSGDYDYVNYCNSKANMWDCPGGYSIYSKSSTASTNSFDYDHCTGSVSSYSGAEAHKTTGTPVYVSGTNTLTSSSPGYGVAPLINNINDMYTDPDMGAEQHGETYYYGRANLELKSAKLNLNAGQLLNPNASQLLDNDGLFSVYPNPVTRILTINGENSTGVMPKIEFYNLTGQKVLQVQDVTFPYHVDISSFKPDVYFIRVLNGNKRYVEKVVKE